MSPTRRKVPDINLLTAASRADVRKLLLRMSPVVRSRFGRKAHPSVADVRAILRELKLGPEFARWAFALYCSRVQFDEERGRSPSTGDYQAMRRQISKFFFDGKARIDPLDPKAVREMGHARARPTIEEPVIARILKADAR